MSTQYRTVVHCDAQLSTECAGFLEITVEALHRLPQQADIVAKGWTQVYRGQATYDVCPDCQKRLARKAKAEPKKEQPSEPT